MINTPYFSVLIPTKNRSHLVAFAIRSVLSQTFSDFEIVVADNDDSSTATHDVVLSFQDARVRYVRSGGLNMSENWEFALDHARGEYVTVLEDKQAYYPWALERMHELIAATGSKVVMWEWDIYRDRKRLAFRNRHSRTAEIVAAEEILGRYVVDPIEAWRYLPRMLNSCASHDVIRRIKQHPAVRRFFDETTPDLCAAFLLLANVDRHCILSDGLGLVGYFHESNALKMAVQKDAMRFYGGTEQLLEASVQYVPIKSPRLVQNLVYNDFRRIQENIGERLRGFEMTPTVYAKLCARDIVYNALRGGRAMEDWRRLCDFVRKGRAIKVLAWFSIGTYLFGEMLRWVGIRLRPAFPGTYGKIWRGEDIGEAAKTLVEEARLPETLVSNK